MLSETSEHEGYGKNTEVLDRRASESAGGKLSRKTARSQTASKARHALPAYPPVALDVYSRERLGGKAQEDLGGLREDIGGLVPVHDLDPFIARAHYDTIKLTLVYERPTHCNTVVAQLREAFNVETQVYKHKFMVLGTDENRRALLRESHLRHRITIHDLSPSDLLAVSKIPGLASSPRVNRLDVAVDQVGGKVHERRQLQIALSLLYPARQHDLEERSCPRQVFNHPLTGAKRTQLRMIGTGVDWPDDRIAPYHHLMPIPDASTYFGSKYDQLETNIYHKVIAPDKKSRLPESEQLVRVEVRLWHRWLEKFGISSADALLKWRPSKLAKLFTFEAAMVERSEPTSLSGIWIRQRLKERARAGVFAVREQYHDTEPRMPYGISRRRTQKATLSYEKLNQRYANALQKMGRDWHAELCRQIT